MKIEIGAKIKLYREQQGLSMTALAKKADVAQSGLSEIEAGKRQPTVDWLDRILTALNLTWAEFVDENGPELPPSIRELIINVQSLNPKQIEALNHFIEAITDTSAAEEAPVTIKVPEQIEDEVAKQPYPHMRLKALRKEKGLSIEEAAEQIGGYMTPERLREIEAGNLEPDPSIQFLFYKFYNVTPAFIFGHTNQRIGTMGPAYAALDAMHHNTYQPDKPPSAANRKWLRKIREEKGLKFDSGEEEEE